MPTAPFLLAWQTFYFIVATAAATLAGLLFVGLTFSAGVVKGDVLRLVRIWVEPLLLDYVQVLGIGAVAVMPDLTPVALGSLLLALWLWRAWRYLEVLRHFKGLGEKSDLELSDWVELAVLPGLLLLLLAGAGAGFLLGQAWAPLALALNLLGSLLLTLYNTWSQWVWMLAEKSKKD
jgi:hypothetical protein